MGKKANRTSKGEWPTSVVLLQKCSKTNPKKKGKKTKVSKKKAGKRHNAGGTLLSTKKSANGKNNEGKTVYNNKMAHQKPKQEKSDKNSGTIRAQKIIKRREKTQGKRQTPGKYSPPPKRPK